jgi:hypothetical protein
MTLVQEVNQNAATAATWNSTMMIVVSQLIVEYEYAARPVAICVDTGLLKRCFA